MDKDLTENLKWIKKQLVESSLDWTVCIVGPEGSGKTTLGLAICAAFDPSFNASRVAYSAEDVFRILNEIGDDSCGRAIMLDEAAESLYAMDFAKRETKAMVKMFMRIRKRRLLFVLCLPSFNDLVRNIRERRVKTVIRCVLTHENDLLTQGVYKLYSFKRLQQYLENGSWGQPNLMNRFHKSDVPEQLWNDVQQRNKAFLSTLEDGSEKIAVEAQNALDLKILNACKKLLGDVSSKSIPVQAIVEELALGYGFTPNWLNSQLISRKIKRFGFYKQRKIVGDTQLNCYVIEAEPLAKHLDAINARVK